MHFGFPHQVILVRELSEQDARGKVFLRDHRERYSLRLRHVIFSSVGRLIVVRVDVVRRIVVFEFEQPVQGDIEPDEPPVVHDPAPRTPVRDAATAQCAIPEGLELVLPQRPILDQG